MARTKVSAARITKNARKGASKTLPRAQGGKRILPVPPTHRPRRYKWGSTFDYFI
jgi:hypothetical protein